MVVAVAVLFVLLTSLRGIAIFFTDYLWFGSVGLTSVWTGVLGAKIGLAVAFSGLFFLAMWINLAIADRLAPSLASLSSEDELVQRYRSFVGRRPILVRTIVAVVLGLLAGTGASAEWQSWILFTNGGSFGVTDPQFHRDIGFFVFKLPFLSFVVGWAFVALVVVVIVTAVAHYLNGGIRVQGPGQRVSAQVKAHLSLLLSLIALVKAAGYYLQRFQLDLSTRGYRQGALYTDVHVQLPAINLLIFISLVSFLIFIVNIRRQGWVLPVIGIGLWAFVSVVAGAIIPAIVQTFTVQPDQLAKELPYIQRNIDASRVAIGINNVHVSRFSDSPGMTPARAARHLSSIQDARLWDPQFANTSYNKLQGLRPYYQLSDLGLDRYVLDGKLTPTIVAVRQLNAGGLPAPSWVNAHLQYTHGYGAVLSPANQATSDGNPTFAIADIPPKSTDGAPAIKQPAVYFGVGMSGYVIAHTKQPELNYQNTQTGQSEEGQYQGTGGVPAGGLLTRAAFALRFGDLNPLISSLVTSQSRVMFVRDIRDRVQKVAPFLAYDANPYPVIVNGHIDYVQDAYTVTDHYPYGQSADTSALPSGSGLNANFNYVRNSVKVVINAYTGAMTFYVIDPHDPIVQAYEHAFPRLFTPASAMPPAIASHLRYPTDLFTVQAAMYGRYHITGASNFYNAGDAWTLSQDPGTGPITNVVATGPTNLQGQPVAPSQSKRMDPIYQVNQLPGDSSLSFNLTEPYVAVSQDDTQQNLTGFLVARSDAQNFGDGQLQVYETPRGQQFNGPALVNAQIQQNSKISSAISLIDQHGSTVLLGTVLLIPIDNSLLYVRPLYVQSAQNPVPQLQQIIVVYGNQSAMEKTLAGALADVLGASVPGLGAPSVAPSPTPSATGRQGSPSVAPAVIALITQANADLAQGQADLRQGDLGGYQSEVNKAQHLLDQAQRAASPSLPTATPSAGSPANAPATPGTNTTATTAAPGTSPTTASTTAPPAPTGTTAPA